MTNLSLSAAVFTLVLGTAACLDHTQGPLEQITGTAANGTVSGNANVMPDVAGSLNNVTLTARDVGGDGTIVNSETYANLDHGFELELPGGHYKLQFTDPAGHVLATWPDVFVDGDVKLAPQTAAE